MRHAMIAALSALLALTPLAVSAAQSSITLDLGGTGDFERRVHNYDCAADAPLSVTYINAAPNFLALVPVPDEAEPLVFVSILSGSGARYAAGQWIWWNTGTDASLYDATLGEDAEPVLTCTEIVDTP